MQDRGQEWSRRVLEPLLWFGRERGWRNRELISSLSKIWSSVAFESSLLLPRILVSEFRENTCGGAGDNNAVGLCSLFFCSGFGFGILVRNWWTIV